MTEFSMSALAPTHDATGTDDLRSFGYKQELRRSLGGFSAFAAGFSFVSILTTVFQLFGLGYGLGGTLFFWTWPIVLVGQLGVALSFAELAAKYPLAGSVYQWARQLVGGFFGWLAGWFMLLGCIVALAAAAIALQVVLPSVWSGFQIVSGDSAIASPTGAANAVLLGSGLLVLTTLVNVAGVKFVGRVNDVGVTAELAGVVVLLVGLAIHLVRGPGVVVTDHHAGDPSPGTSGVLVSMLAAAYVFYGFDNAASVSEETKNARRAGPRGILRALLFSGVGAVAVVLLALMAAPSLTDGQLATVGLPYVIDSIFGHVTGKIFLADVAIAISVATLTIQTGTIRLFYSMARDQALPAAKHLARVNPRTGTPIIGSILSGVLAVAILVVNIKNPALFTVVCGTSVVFVYLAYLLVTGPLLVQRLRGHFQSEIGYFTLGRWAIVVNAVAVLYGLSQLINIAWPRSVVYDFTGSGQWWSLFFPIIAVGVLTAGGYGYWTSTRRSAR